MKSCINCSNIKKIKRGWREGLYQCDYLRDELNTRHKEECEVHICNMWKGNYLIDIAYRRIIK